MLTRKEYSVSFDIVETNTGFDLLHTIERLHLNSLPWIKSSRLAAFTYFSTVDT